MATTHETATLFAHAVDEFMERLAAVSADDWDRPTPCSDWDVRALVNHVVGEQRWVVPLMEGRTIAEVGDSLDGDLLGPAPLEAADSAAKAAVAAMTEPGAMGRTVQLSSGATSAEEYAWQLLVDHVVHAWDLAVAAGGDVRLDQDLVARTAHWWAEWEEAYRSFGAVAERFPVPPHASRQDRLLGTFGRDPNWSAVRAAVARFGAAWEAWDLDRITACLAADAVFESTGPAPDGVRHVGRDEIRAAWQEMFATTRDARFEFEDTVVCGHHAVARWRFSWTNDDGSTGHVRGIDQLRVNTGGRIVEKLSYVKG